MVGCAGGIDRQTARMAVRQLTSALKDAPFSLHPMWNQGADYITTCVTLRLAFLSGRATFQADIVGTSCQPDLKYFAFH